jgi:hypothetical protein
MQQIIRQLVFLTDPGIVPMLLADNCYTEEEKEKYYYVGIIQIEVCGPGEWNRDQ